MDLIYNQRQIPAEQWRYGLRSSAAVGCGWIATYNALRLLGYRTNIEELIRYFERQLPPIHGNAGTSYWGPYVCFRNWGFPVRLCHRFKDYDRVAGESDVCILFYHWRDGFRLGAHFVALHKKNDVFVGYNTYRNSTGPDRYGPSLQAFLKERGYFASVLISIGQKNQNQGLSH